ncbi:MAG: Asp23/Gls24 family envelope stress response protein [Bacteroidales bacterium]|nr:Asp23/Gls24 family envelope stress response protein [Bacteroidales bacterium]
MSMEQEAEKNGYESQAERIGTVKIADDVVAMIAALAATEVEGVAAMAGNLTNELLSRVGVRGLSRGARVEVSGEKVKAELAIVMEYGYNIPATCQKVQSKVKNAIENMTGLEVQDVNIRIAGINVTKEK